jgi:CheY-like chemotaxis protein
LIVDDEYDITLTFKIGLEDNGFIVDSFTDAVLALSNFRAGLYDVVILDVKMPKIDGFELWRQMKLIDDKSNVCFMTAFDTRKGDLNADSMLFNKNKNKDNDNDENHPYIIQKPVTLNELIRQVNAVKCKSK